MSKKKMKNRIVRMNAAIASACNATETFFGMKSIPGFSDYLISKTGEVFSLIRAALVKPWIHKSGHLYLKLRNDDQNKTGCQVHRLVLLTYIGNPENGQECLHKDGNPTNNAIDNLMWGTRLQNVADYKRHNGRHMSGALEIDIARKIRGEYSGIRGEQTKLAKKYGVSVYVINDLVNNKTYKEEI